MKIKKSLSIISVIFISLAVFVSAVDYNSFTWINGNENSDSADLRYDIYLAKGWNLVPSFYKVSRIADSSQIKSSDIKVIYAYLPNKNKYAQLYPEDYSSNQDFLESYYQENTVIPHSFWVYSEKSGVLEFNVYEQEKEVFSTISLKSGWNFLGVNKNLANKKLNDIAGDCEISKAYLWNNYEHIKQQDGSVLVRDINPEWEQINTETIFANAGWMRGVIIKVTSDCTLGTSGSSINPPQIPETQESYLIKEDIGEYEVYLESFNQNLDFISGGIGDFVVQEVNRKDGETIAYDFEGEAVLVGVAHSSSRFNFKQELSSMDSFNCENSHQENYYCVYSSNEVPSLAIWISEDGYLVGLHGDAVVSSANSLLNKYLNKYPPLDIQDMF